MLGYPGGILHSAEVKPENFDEAEIEALVDDLIAGIKTKRAAAALIEAISRCGALLAQYEVARRPDDEDELPDAPRIRER